MRAPATPRRRWPIVLIVVILAALAGYGIYAVSQANTGKSTATPTSSPTATPSASTSGAVTGCLGGSGRDVAMLLAAMSSAPHSTSGAAEFAAAYVRWMHQYPNPPASDASKALEAFATSVKSFDLAGYLNTHPNLSGGVVGDGENFASSTVGGVYRIETATADAVTVSIGTQFVIAGQLSTTLKGSITVSTVWENGAWRFASSQGTRTTEDLFTIGTPFTGGC